MNETFRIFRLYCQLGIDDVASLTKIRKKRLIEIETGKSEPTDEELKKLAALYNVSPERMKRGLCDNFPTIVKQPIDYSFFRSEFERELMKESITSLSQEERDLLLILRTADNKKELYGRIFNMVIAEDDTIIKD